MHPSKIDFQRLTRGGFWVMRNSFTLVEMLVVVSIIGILVALSASAIKPIRAKMQLSQCADNMRQIAVGCFAYAAEHDNSLPAVFQSAPAAAKGQQDYWNWPIWTYVYAGTTPQYPEYDTQFSPRATYKWRPNAFRCPSTAKGAIKAPTVSALSDARMSYGLNNTMMIIDGSGAWVDQRTASIPLTRVANPGSTAMVIEASNADAGFSTWGSSTGIIPHNGGANVLFFDGHIEWRVSSNIPAGGWSVNTNVFWRGY